MTQTQYQLKLIYEPTPKPMELFVRTAARANALAREWAQHANDLDIASRLEPSAARSLKAAIDLARLRKAVSCVGQSKLTVTRENLLEHFDDLGLEETVWRRGVLENLELLEDTLTEINDSLDLATAIVDGRNLQGLLPEDGRTE